MMRPTRGGREHWYPSPDHPRSLDESQLFSRFGSRPARARKNVVLNRGGSGNIVSSGATATEGASPDAQEIQTVTDWDRIVREYGPLVFATAWRILGHAADTEDVVQEVFLQVHQLQQTHPVRHWAGLLRRLASCRALDRLRQRCAPSRSTVCLSLVPMRDRKQRPWNANWPNVCAGHRAIAGTRSGRVLSALLRRSLVPGHCGRIAHSDRRRGVGLAQGPSQAGSVPARNGPGEYMMDSQTPPPNEQNPLHELSDALRPAVEQVSCRRSAGRGGGAFD